ncbi:S-(hydroxymethyl)glutathione dehydrogenase/class III alcohol dehydrogenase, partial [Vibrio parahaemolyticus V-223/04]
NNLVLQTSSTHKNSTSQFKK